MPTEVSSRTEQPRRSKLHLSERDATPFGGKCNRCLSQVQASTKKKPPGRTRRFVSASATAVNAQTEVESDITFLHCAISPCPLVCAFLGLLSKNSDSSRSQPETTLVANFRRGYDVKKGIRPFIPTHGGRQRFWASTIKTQSGEKEQMRQTRKRKYILLQSKMIGANFSQIAEVGVEKSSNPLFVYKIRIPMDKMLSSLFYCKFESNLW